MQYHNHNKELSISNILIWLSFFATILSIFNSNLFIFWMNNYFLNRWEYHFYILQFFTSNFLHWWVMHLFFNSMFIYYFWNQIESIIWKKRYILFFLISIILTGIWLTIIWLHTQPTNTIWISWFCMALITYYTIHLKNINHPDFRWWITAIIINLAIWLQPQISLFWHFFWVISGILFYYFDDRFLKKLV